jgi:hypothetical protein
MTNRSCRRDALGEKFVADFLADWQQNGATAIAALRAEKPSDYVRIAASILPKERNAKPEPLDELTDAELLERIGRVAARAGFEIRAAAPAERGGATGESRDLHT